MIRMVQSGKHFWGRGLLPTLADPNSGASHKNGKNEPFLTSCIRPGRRSSERDRREIVIANKLHGRKGEEEREEREEKRGTN